MQSDKHAELGTSISKVDLDLPSFCFWTEYLISIIEFSFITHKRLVTRKVIKLEYFNSKPSAIKPRVEN